MNKLLLLGFILITFLLPTLQAQTFVTWSTGSNASTLTGTALVGGVTVTVTATVTTRTGNYYDIINHPNQNTILNQGGSQSGVLTFRNRLNSKG